MEALLKSTIKGLLKKQNEGKLLVKMVIPIWLVEGLIREQWKKCIYERLIHLQAIKNEIVVKAGSSDSIKDRTLRLNHGSLILIHALKVSPM